MIITKNIQKYLSFTDDSVLEVLKKISENNARIVFIVTEHSILKGVVSDGDIRRWLVNVKDIDLNVPIKNIMHCEVRKFPVGTSTAKISSSFRRGVDCIPLVDDIGRLVSLAFQKSLSIDVEGSVIAAGSPSFVIAEVGNNHQGDMDMARRLVDAAIDAGANCVKFQMRDTQNLYLNCGNDNDAGEDLGSQYTLDLLSKFQLTDDQLKCIFDYCRKQGIIPLCTPWDIPSLNKLEQYGLAAYKIASADFTNFELLEAVANTGKPMICSTGMCSESEIRESVDFLRDLSANYILLHCNSTYPTPFKDINLKYMARLRELSGAMIGYSGHERGFEVAIAAVALGAVVIEKHITLDKALEGNDHKVSLLPDEFATMMKQIRNVEKGLGSESSPREITQGELINRETLAKSLVAKIDIDKGQVITRNMVKIKSPGKGLQPNRLNDLVGKIANRSILKNDCFYGSDIHGKIEKRSTYHFSRPYGIPTRYHDFDTLIDGVDVSFVEFHLSYKDLSEDVSRFFNDKQTIGLAVHSPELFEKDHILDLCSEDNTYRHLSIDHMCRVIEVTNKISEFFPKTDRPVLIVNAGGWDKQGFIDSDTRRKRYDILVDSLSTIDFSSVQLAIQTMPPFPWHFGGQSYHNLFVDADEIQVFCQKQENVKICLDISHSMMACNYYGWNLIDFVEKIAPYVAHLHVVDAKGIDGEGIEIGLGDVDFFSLANSLNDCCPDISFIPEVWQGHKNSGEGFWKALDFLENIGI